MPRGLEETDQDSFFTVVQINDWSCLVSMGLPFLDVLENAASMKEFGVTRCPEASTGTQSKVAVGV